MEAWRNLTSNEIIQLQAQHCQAENWDQIQVSPDFTVKNISEILFSGNVFLGCFSKVLTLPGGVPVESGIHRARIHQCCISDNVYIDRVNRYIANYRIGEGSVIENVDCLFTEGESRFGNGTVLSVLDETGGKPVMMYNRLSAHTAHLMVTNAHRPLLVQAINKLILDYAKTIWSTMGEIGKNCCIRNAGTIRNVRMEDGCEVDGASLLDDGSLCSGPTALSGENGGEPLMAFAYAGTGVIARHFILAPAAVVKDHVQLERCFVGESAQLSHGFTAHDSLFFSNCQMENGEACAAFAGPYTVSMHKSSLLVGGMYSFCNLGSGTNQSNHLYKLGPMHSGIMDRGCKTGSDTYILWPGRIGAFTFVKGRHVNNPDTRIFPFSHLLEENECSYLVPGATLRSIGNFRDEIKWPQRDKRTTLFPMDQICFETLNPATIGAIRQGLAALDDFEAMWEGPEMHCSGIVIRKSSAKKGRKLYQNALLVYMGTSLVKKLESLEAEVDPSVDVLDALVAVKDHFVSEKWTDLSGLLVPDSELSLLLTKLEEGRLKTMDALEREWLRFYDLYPQWNWELALNLLAKECRKTISDLDATDFKTMLQIWQEALLGFYKQMLADGSLEMSMLHRFVPGGKQFSHPFIVALEQMMNEIPEKTARCIDLLK